MAQQSFNHWQAVADAVRPSCKDAVRVVANAGVRNVRAVIRAKGLIRTGFMLHSVYSNSSDSSTYTGGARAFPEVGRPGKETEANIAVAATYAAYPNYGTRYMTERPFFEPGVEKTKADFEKAMRTVKRRIEEAAR